MNPTLRLICTFLSLIGFLPVSALAAAPAPPAKVVTPPTLQEAKDFIARAEEKLLELWIRGERAGWLAATFITDDTELIAAQAKEAIIETTMELARKATRFDGMQLPEDLARKLKLIKLSLVMPAPADAKVRQELTEIVASLEGDYGKGRFCPEGPQGKCHDLGDLEAIMATSRDPGELLKAWKGWRTISPPMRERYARFVDLSNQGARELGFADTGALWRSKYDMSPDEFAQEVDRLWQQVRPLYESLHCYVRSRLSQKYGPDLVPPGKPIPAHLLGNMWGQSWGNIYELVRPPKDDPGFDLTALLKAKGVDEKEMVRYGERFFTGLGLPPLPATFWERSLLKKPVDHDAVCHASAWDIDFADDLRIKMCIKTDAEDFVTIHHELGHNYYQRAYKIQPPLFRDSANDGFHEAIGDTIALSITPQYLVQIGLLPTEPDSSGDVGLLMQQALEKIAFLPFSVVVDQWRWQVFSGQVKPDHYNQAWWDLVLKYQGLVPPVPRSETDFDPGAKYHVPANVPYTRYFLAHILQFQFHRDLTALAGQSGPVHRRTINGNKEVGARLQTMLEMGQSRPWPVALTALTGQNRMDATAILDYFAPLKKWLDEQNRGQQCGW